MSEKQIEEIVARMVEVRMVEVGYSDRHTATIWSVWAKDEIGEKWMGTFNRQEDADELKQTIQNIVRWALKGSERVRENVCRSEVREQLADLMHQIWAGQMTYLFSKCSEYHERGQGVQIPQSWANRWASQLNTPYAKLSEEEKEAGRSEADLVLALLRKAIWPRESK